MFPPTQYRLSTLIWGD